MREIELFKGGIDNVKSRYVDKNNTFKHITGRQIKLLPFKTNPAGDSLGDDFKSFQGITGEIFRLSNGKAQIEFEDSKDSFKANLKENILNSAINNVETEHTEQLKNILTQLFFEEDNSLVKFHIKTLPYMNFIASGKSLNAVKEISTFISDIFLKDIEREVNLNVDTEAENILSQLIIDNFPDLPNVNSKQDSSIEGYENFFPEIKKQFNDDFTFLSSNKSLFLKHIEDFFKYYYFHYLSQLVINLNEFGKDEKKIRPIYFTMDWETLSESRLRNHVLGWKELNKYSSNLFYHANTLELLNYIYIDGSTIKNYNDFVTIYDELSEENRKELREYIIEISSFYKESIPLTSGSWEECENKLNIELSAKMFTSQISKNIFTLYFLIKYQFDNTQREHADQKYAQWYLQFGKLNYTKSRGRLGNTTVLSQELLLFLTKLCIGNQNKIRLKTLWEKLKERGITFDEMSKLEIIKLFEKINLIEKKSDSGDAQYVKSTI
ncbi:DNA phosphorothioation-dependent restriction protein DptG [Chryseobacterium sp. NRRL B-14859]|uniref:DNA phosphorothioation-dependent restriction protein DptG n=1 Tax=unclassified Chryseobacterium TaxID=2593645 RepID=UPI003342201A